MTKKRHILPESLQLLVIRMGKQCYGVEVSQIAAIAACREDPSHAKWLWKMLALSPPRSEKFNIIQLKSNVPLPAIIINEPEDIISVKVRQIRPFPRLLARFAQDRGLWGVVMNDGDVLLLLDLHKLSLSLLEATSLNKD